MEFQTPKLSLELRPTWLEDGEHGKGTQRSSELKDYIARLEDELRKIEVFKRELPLSVEITNDAIEKLKREVASNGEADEIPSAVSENGIDGDKKSWMSSAQLWGFDQTLSLQLNSNKAGDGYFGQATKYADNGVALSSVFAGPISPSVNGSELAIAGPEFVLGASEPTGVNKVGVYSGQPVVVNPLKIQFGTPLANGQRKQRRCWSPELHWRFIEALDSLGGSRVATPKQIGDRMNVDGLTNDEVKSHLQKYRLHVGKLPNAGPKPSQHESNGGSTSGTSNSEANQSGSPQGPLHLTISSAKSNSPASRYDSMECDYGEKSDSHSRREGCWFVAG